MKIKRKMRPSNVKLICVAFMLLAQSKQSVGQKSDLALSIPSPNASSIQQYGDIPVSYFNGLAQISIPIDAIKCGDQAFPISIGYHGGGIKADEHPGTTGLGWSLEAGGVITRKQNDGPDEFLSISSQTPQYKGYYYSGYKLNTTNWTDPSFLLNAKNDLPLGNNPYLIDDGEPDEFSFSFLNHSGKFFRDEKNQWRVVSNEDLTFSIEEQLGSDFYLPDVVNPNYNIKLKSIFKSFVITTGDGYRYYFGGDPSTIEFSRGIFYSGSNSYWSIDGQTGYALYVTPVSWYLTRVESPTGERIDLTYERGEPLFEKRKVRGHSEISTTAGGMNTQADDESTTGSAINPVYVKKIKTASMEINFDYSTSVEKRYGNFSNNENNHYTNSINQLLLQWPDFTGTYGNIAPHDELLPHNYKQLNLITVKDLNSGDVYKRVEFLYDNDLVNATTTGRRLTLYKLLFWGSDYGTAQKYSFEYNNVGGLPDYGTRQSDHWGYFNGVSYAASPNIYEFDNWRQPDATKMAYGILNKITYPTGGSASFLYEPHTYSKSVNASINPGQFLYSLAVSDEGSNKMAGGLRIKKIISTPAYGGVDVAKEYKYEITGGNSSSGILAGKPFYKYIVKTNSPACYDKCPPTSASYGGTWTFSEMSDNSSYNPISVTKGSHITYSEVKEISNDGGYTTYAYTNYNSNNCMDEIHTAMARDQYAQYNNFYEISSKEVERGLLTAKQSFDNTGSLVSSETYDYSDDQTANNAFSKAITAKFTSTSPISPCSAGGNDQYGPCIIATGYAYAKKHYYYNKLLKKTIQTLYNNGQPIANTKEYSYDNYRNITESTELTSDGQKIIQTTRYNSHPDYLAASSSDVASSIRNLFYGYKITNTPIETTSTILPLPVNGGTVPPGSARMTSGTLWLFSQNLPVPDKICKMELPEPFYPVTYSSPSNPTYNYIPSKIVNGALEADSRYRVQSTVNTFTTISSPTIGPSTPLRPLSVSTIDNNFAYTWGYAMQFPTSVTKNTPMANLVVSGNLEVQTAYTSFEGDYSIPGFDHNKGNWNYNHSLIMSGGFTGKREIRLYEGASNGDVTSAFVLKQGKKYILSFWSKNAMPQLLNGTTPFGPGTSQPSNGWQYYEFEVTGSNQPIVIKAQSNNGSPYSIISYLDEVRLYPADARMESYTYNSLGSITSMSDGSGRIIFYEYDFFGRLKAVKDQDGNILKSTGYTIQGPQ